MDSDGIKGLIFLIVMTIIVVFIIIRIDKALKKSKTVKSASDYVNVNLKKAIKNSQITISKSYLTSCSWILINEENQDIFYTFRSNEELLITVNGIVEKAQYELIVDNDTILITQKGITEHFFIYREKDDFLFLRRLSSNKVLYFANQTKYKDELKSKLLRIAEEYNK